MPPVLVKHLMSSPVVSLFAEQTLPLVEDIMQRYGAIGLPTYVLLRPK